MTLNGPDAGRDAMPCPECPEQHLNAYLQSPEGRLIKVVCDLDFALQARINVSLDDILYHEFVLLRQLVEAREAYQNEEMKKKQH